MEKLNPRKVGLTVGAFAGIWHLVWSILVALGWAEPLLNFVTSMHFLQNVHHVAEFNIGTALGLIVLASLVGYVAGMVFALVWNRLH